MHLRLLCLLPLLCISFFSLAQQQLTSFEQITEALHSGKTVQAVFYYHRCELFVDGEEQEKMPEIIGGMRIGVFEWFGERAVGNPNAFFVASTSKLIKNPLGEGYVYNYAKVKVLADNTVKITAQYLNPQTFEVEMDELFVTQIADKKNEAGAYFYTAD